MQAAWEILCVWGVPAGAVREPARAPLPAEQVGKALRALAETNFQDLDGLQRECLFAWLRGFRHEWPHRFEAILGPSGHVAITALADAETDPNRYLKLRRIAIENLATSL